jgi:hypothetical protein
MSDGSISVTARRGTASTEDAVQSVIDLLAQLLVAAGPGVPPRLLSLIEERAQTRKWDLARLRDELESALVPLNRGASRRVLSRMLRETKRADGPSAVAPAPRPIPDEGDMDAELDALMHGGEASGTGTLPGQPVWDGQPAATVADPPSEDSQAFIHTAPRPPIPAGPWAETPEGHRITAPPRAVDLGGLGEEPRAGKGPLVWALLFAGLLLGLVVLVFVLRPDAIDRLGGEGDAAEDRDLERSLSEEEERERALRARRAGVGKLVVHVPERAQVLMFVGRGPAVDPHVALGVAQEFVAVADNGATSRAVIVADASWSNEGDRRRYELAIQTPPAAAPVSVDLGQSLLSPDVGTPTGEEGEVRIVTSPPGAKVYRLIGFGPEVEGEDLATDASYELLVYLEGHRLERVVVGPSDWLPSSEGPTAEIRVELPAR